MKQQRTVGNVLRREIAVTVHDHAMVPADIVFDVLANLPNHMEWGGAEASTLLSMQAPIGLATVGTEFTSTAEDRICRMQDSSVVTEALRPRTFERVTESALESKKYGTRAGWLLVHRYEIESKVDQSEITYTCRLVRASGLPGVLSMFGFPLLRSFAAREWARANRGGLRRLIAAAEAAPRD